MTSRTRILLLFDNNGSEYVSRIQDAVGRCARSLGFPVQSENLFTSRRPIAEVVESEAFAGILP
jgi:hypothetical protein